MRVAIANDTPMVAEALRRMVTASARHEVLWIAHDGAEAVARASGDRPDVILMDLVMPGMDGIEATRRIMALSPCPILVVTASVEGNTGKVFEAMGAGALDAIDWPPLHDEHAVAGLLHKIDVVGRLGIGDDGGDRQTTAKPLPPKHVDNDLPYLVALGASSGGPQALATVLKGLPAHLAAAVVIVQHVDPQFAPRLAEWLDAQVPLPVRTAREGDELQERMVYVAASSDSLILRPSLTLGYTPLPDNFAYRPSIDVFFETVATHWPGPVCAALLTGMGRDGADGLRMLRNCGAYTIAQDARTSSIYGMPKAAVELGAAVDTLPIDSIAGAIVEDINKNNENYWASRGSYGGKRLRPS